MTTTQRYNRAFCGLDCDGKRPDCCKIRSVSTPTGQHGVDYCEGCEGSSGKPPVTKKGFCVDCASRACAEAYGEHVGLPTGFDLAPVIPKLIQHMNRCQDRDGCKVCSHGTFTCNECSHDIHSVAFHDNRWPHLVLGTFVLIGCEGYWHPILRAAQAELL